MYVITAKPDFNRLTRTIEQEAATEALRDKWVELFQRNGWKIVEVKLSK